MHKKLFIPGPTEVREDILKKMSTPMIGHRGKEFETLFAGIIPKMQQIMYTKNPVLLSTSSATGLMEAAVRNCTDQKCLNLCCGAFSERWHEITTANGKAADTITVDWGKAIKPEMLREKLESGSYDAVTFTHNETSTGVMNPIVEVAEVMKDYPDIIFMVDAVSSFAGTKIEVDRLGIDILLFSVQKAMALPPGFSVCSVSKKALKKAETVKNKGHYFNFLDLMKSYEKNQTPYTPSIPHMYALDQQLTDILKEGLENRFQRHKDMARIVRSWAKENFELYAEPGYESDTLTTISNTKNISIGDLNKKLGERGYTISNGYGKIKDTTFRIAHMGDIQVEEVKALL
ncbi:MAG: alanine--glyoxylate aminotransferase family protein, partial [archaeon]